MTRTLRLLASLLSGAVLLPLLLLAGAAPPANAVRALAHGDGVTWLGDHTSWLGNYRLADGRSGYCLEVTKSPPAGSDVDYLPGASAGYSTDDAARLAFISRHWGAPGDALTAASAQLATWTVTGLGGHDQAFFARRANGDAGLVTQAANRMLELANGDSGASRGATATLGLDASGIGARVLTDLWVDFLSGAHPLAPASYYGDVTLVGATFADGSRRAYLPNGLAREIVPDEIGDLETISARVEYHALPFGADFRFGRNTGGSQSLLVSEPNLLSAAATADTTSTSELPFRPRVETVTSAAVASPGAAVTDTLTLDAHPDSATGGRWGLFQAPDGAFLPIPVVVASVLWGPFGTPPVLSSTVPADARPVCRSELSIDTGPGVYATAPCTVPSPGYYVWTDSIDPARTPADRGGTRLQGFTSPFGVASETTLVPATPRLDTTATLTPASAAAPSSGTADAVPAASADDTPLPSAAPTGDGTAARAAARSHVEAATLASLSQIATASTEGPASALAPAPGGEPFCARDRLVLAGLPEGAPPLSVVSTLIGPLPADAAHDADAARGADAAQDPDAARGADAAQDAGAARDSDAARVPTPPADPLPVAGRVTTLLDADGAHRTDCIPVTTPGFYYFVFDATPTTSTPTPVPSIGSETGAAPDLPAAMDGDRSATLADSSMVRRFLTETEAAAPEVAVAAVAAEGSVAREMPVLVKEFSDHRVLHAESFVLTPPPATTPPTTPPAVSTPAPAPPPYAAPERPVALASTGVPAMPAALTVAAAVLGLMTGLAGLAFALRRWP
ncbi:hypothetical protein [Herbiconiux solani]|uniref:hypothetical protein n=1 Tax=Herbiconiux solani TaxID=661329 RepID=UPI000824119D|nr:hypothetical protein [Herbiconiux solani]